MSCGCRTLWWAVLCIALPLYPSTCHPSLSACVTPLSTTAIQLKKHHSRFTTVLLGPSPSSLSLILHTTGLRSQHHIDRPNACLEHDDHKMHVNAVASRPRACIWSFPSSRYPTFGAPSRSSPLSYSLLGQPSSSSPSLPSTLALGCAFPYPCQTVSPGISSTASAEGFDEVTLPLECDSFIGPSTHAGCPFS